MPPTAPVGGKLCIALLNWLITLARLIWRRASKHKILQVG